MPCQGSADSGIVEAEEVSAPVAPVRIKTARYERIAGGWGNHRRANKPGRLGKRDGVNPRAPALAVDDIAGSGVRGGVVDASDDQRELAALASTTDWVRA